MADKAPKIWITPLVLGLVLGVSPSVATAARKPEPRFLHGVAQVVGGVLLELPKTVLEATVNGPPIVGTAVGLLAGTARALQTTVAGLVEMSAGFDPWGTKRKRRR